MTGSTSWITAAPGRSRRTALGASVAITALAWCVQAQALPVVGSAGGVVGGSATIVGVNGTDTVQTITQTTSRALIQWQSFNVANGETVNFVQPSSSSITFNVIPFNFNTKADIDGIINANTPSGGIGGGVWLYSPRGAIIGPNANINVGSFLLTTGTTNYTLNMSGGPGNFPMPGELNGNSIAIFGATSSIDVQQGAQINATAGFVVLNSETLTQNGDVTATDGIAYAVGDGATIGFDPNGEFGQVLQSVDVSGSLPGEPNFSQAGTSTGAWVGVYAPDFAEQGFTGIINMGGTTEATGIAPVSADTSAVLLAGSNNSTPPQFANDITVVDTSKGSINADQGGLLAEGGQITLGQVSVAGDINVYAASSDSGPGNSPLGGSINIGGSNSVTVSAGGNIFLGSSTSDGTGTISINDFSALQAAGNVTISGSGSGTTTVNVGFFSSIQAASQGGDGSVNIEAGGVNANQFSQIYAGSDPGDPTGDVTIRADFNDLDVGNVSGVNVNLTAGVQPGDCDDCEPVGANLNVSGTIVGTNSVTITAVNGSIDIEGNVTSGGPLDITAADDIAVDNNGAGITLESDSFGEGDGDVTILAGGQYTASNNSTIQGGPDGLNPTAAVSIEADGGDLTTGAINGTDVDLTTDNDVFVNGPIYGANSVNFDPANITLAANVTSGGTLDITATNTVTVNAGVIVMSAGDLTVEGAVIAADPSSLLESGSGSVTVTADTGNLTVGQVTGGNVTLNAGSGYSITGGDILIAGNVSGTSSVSVTAYRGSVDVESNVISGGTVLIQAAYNVTVGTTTSGVLIQSDNNNGRETGSGTITVDTGGVYFAAADSELRAGSDPTDPQDAVSITAQNAGLTSGAVEGTNVTFETDNGLTLNGSVLGTSSVLLEGYENEVPETITVGPNVTVSSGSDLMVEATDDVFADPTSLLISGTDPGSPTGNVTVISDTGNVTVGQVSGVDVTLTAGSADSCDDGCSPVGGNLTIGGAVFGADAVTATTYVGYVDVEANVTSGGEVLINSAGDVTVGQTAPNVLIQSDIDGEGSGPINITAGGNYNAASDTELRGGDLASGPEDAVSVTAEGGYLTTSAVEGTNVTLDASGDLNIDGPIFGSFSVTAGTDEGDIDIEANVVSGGPVQITSGGDINIGENTSGVLIQSDNGGNGGIGGAGSGTITITAAGAYTAASDSELRGGDNSDTPEDAVTVTANGGDLTSGIVNGTDVTLITAQDMTINGAIFGGTSVSFDPAESFPTNITINADVTSGGGISVTATNSVTIDDGAVVQAENGALTISAQTIDADNTTLLLAGSDPNTPTNTVTVTGSNGDVTVGAVTGSVVTLTAGNGEGGGDLNINGAIFASSAVDASALNGAIDVEGDVTSGGPITITAGGDITIDQGKNGILIESDANGSGGDINITAGGSYTADAGSTLQGGDVTASGNFPAGGGLPGAAVSVTANGGDLTTGIVNGTDVTLTTNDDLYINGAVFGSNSVTFDPANVFINANVTSGGVLNITADDAVDVAPGITVMSAGDLTISAQTVDADASSLLVAGTDATDPTAAVSVSASNGDLTVGQVTGTTITLTAGTGEGGGDLNILGAIFASSEVDGSAPDGAIDVEANVIAGGPVHLTSGGDIDVGLTSKDAVLIESDSGGNGAGDIEITAGGAYDADGSSELRGGPDGANPTQSVSVTTEDGDMTTGIINGTDVTLEVGGLNLTINGDIYGSDAVTIDPPNVININADVTSGGSLDITANDEIIVAPDVTLRSDTNGAGTGDLTLEANVISADASSQITAGASDDAPTANVSITSDAGDIAVGGVSGGVVTLTSAGDLELDGPVLALTSFTSSSALNTTTNGGSVISDGSATLTAAGTFELSDADSITAATFVKITGADVTLDADSLVRSDSGGETATPAAVTIDAKGSFFASNSSLVVGGASKTAPTAAVAITAGDNTFNSGGDLTSGPISGTTVTLNAFGGTDEESGGHGVLDIDGAILGTQGVFAYSDHGNAGTLPGATNVEANVTSGGTIDIRSEGVGNLTIGQGEGSSTVVISSSAGEVYLFSNAAIYANDGAQVSGVSLDATAETTLNIESGATFATTGSTTAPVWPTVPVTVVAGTGGAAPTVTSLNLAASTLNIQGTVTAGKGGTTDDIYIQALGSPSLVTVGGTGAPSGFNLTSAEFAELNARNVVVEAGGGEGAAHNADINLANLSIDPAKVGGLWLGTSSDHTVTVSGVITGAGDALNIGFAEAPATGTVLVGYIPGEIDVTGSIGSESAPFASVGLLARNNIFMGTSDFITAAKADATFDAVTQSKDFTGLTQGYVFIASNTLQLGAQGRIIQQNTSTLTGQGEDQFTGLVFNAPTTTSPLIADPSGLAGKTIGTGGWAANYGAGPTAIDVFGLIRQTDDSVVSGVDAALQDNLLPTAIETSNSYRINSCIFETNCSISPTNPYQDVPGQVQFQDPTDPDNSNNGNDPIIPPTDGGSSSAANAANAAAGQTFLDNIVEPAASFTDTLVNGSPVTQSGNGDLWEGPNGSVGCTPTTDHPQCPPQGAPAQ